MFKHIAISLVYAVAFFLVFGICLFVGGADNPSFQLVTLVVISLIAGFLTAAVVHLDNRVLAAESALDVLLKKNLGQVNWVFDNPDRIGSHAQTSVESMMGHWAYATDGRAKVHLRAKVLEAIAAEIGRVARTDADRSAHLRFLKKMEKTFGDVGHRTSSGD